MTMTERSVWATLLAFPFVGAIYFAVVVTRAADTPIEDVSWQVPMIWAMASLVVVIILATIASAIATGISAELRGVEPEFEDGDIRDKQIELLGDARAYTVSGLGGLAGIILAMLDADPFWIANTLFLTGIFAGMVAAGIKIHAYRNGI